jgi:hypothetical protein
MATFHINNGDSVWAWANEYTVSWFLSQAS